MVILHISESCGVDQSAATFLEKRLDKDTLGAQALVISGFAVWMMQKKGQSPYLEFQRESLLSLCCEGVQGQDKTLGSQ